MRWWLWNMLLRFNFSYSKDLIILSLTEVCHWVFITFVTWIEGRCSGAYLPNYPGCFKTGGIPRGVLQENSSTNLEEPTYKTLFEFQWSQVLQNDLLKAFLTFVLGKANYWIKICLSTALKLLYITMACIHLKLQRIHECLHAHIKIERLLEIFNTLGFHLIIHAVYKSWRLLFKRSLVLEIRPIFNANGRTRSVAKNGALISRLSGLDERNSIISMVWKIPSRVILRNSVHGLKQSVLYVSTWWHD